MVQLLLITVDSPHVRGLLLSQLPRGTKDKVTSTVESEAKGDCVQLWQKQRCSLMYVCRSSSA